MKVLFVYSKITSENDKIYHMESENFASVLMA